MVEQNLLLRRLCLDGIHGDDWLLLRELYSDCSSRIKWAGELSHPINIRQEVRQGGVISTGHYKRYKNTFLLQLEDRFTGIKISATGITHVTVADDVALLAEDHPDTQVMVWDADNNVRWKRYCIHPTKRHTLHFASQAKKRETEPNTFMAGECVDTPDTTVHLGIVRNTTGRADIDGKISLGGK